MALSQMPFGKPMTYLLSAESALGLAGIENVRNGACTFYGLSIIPAAQLTDAVYVKLYDNNGSTLTIGTTAPDFIIPVGTNASDMVHMHVIGGAALTSGFSAAACEEAGNAVTTAPDENMAVYVTTN